ncbi:MAG TPA: sugar ABC transporter permease [bacterium]|nr:sugar ABC transporter permease [bacterium]
MLPQFSLHRVAQTLQKDPYFGYLLVLPLVVWTLLTIVYPFLDALRLSVFNVGYVGTAGRFVGLANYSKVLTSWEFWHTTEVTVWWTVLNVGLQVVGGLVAALVLNQEFWGHEFARTWIILPWLFPSIVLATIAKWMLDPTLGVVNYLLLHAGVVKAPISFLGTPGWAFLSATIVNAWHWFPLFALMILAALQTIPKEVSDAAEVDGANYWGRLWYVELPCIAQVLYVIIFISSLWAANIFDVIWLLTRGGPGDATNTFPILIYYKGFQEFRISEAAAISIPLFVLLLLYGVWYMRRYMQQEIEEPAA